MEIVLFLGLVGLGYAYYLLREKYLQKQNEIEEIGGQLAKLQNRFAGVLRVDEEIERVRTVLKDSSGEANKIKQKIFEMSEQRDALFEELKNLQGEIDVLETGLYEPHFPLGMSDNYKAEIQKNRQKQKQLITAGDAVKAHVAWKVGGDEKAGKKMMDKAIKLTIRAFNSECDACVANVTWSNIKTMEKRIKKAWDDLNKFNEIKKMVISRTYLELKIQELQLTYEWHERKKQEREEQAELRQQQREEEKARREAEAAAMAAEKEKEQYLRLLEKAREEAQAAALEAAQNLSQESQERVGILNRQLEELSQKLAEAEAKNQRALSMAQQTRKGHVYIISNVGSFGENIYKIGMTRRQDPMDRIDELGDASVPFCFDVHALFMAEDAPAVERKLHEKFAAKRLNKVNTRKEFFRVSLDEIKAEVLRICPDAQFTTTIMAEEYKKSLAMEREALREEILA